MIFIVILSILSVMYGYLMLKLTRFLKLKPVSRNYLWVWLGSSWLSAPVPIYFRYNHTESLWIDIVAWFTYFNLGLFSTLFILLLLYDFYRLAKWGLKRLSIIPADTNQPSFRPDKRVWIMNGIALGISLYGLRAAIRIPDTKKVAVPIKNLPKSLETLKIVQITDVHIGPTIKRPFLEGVVERINKINPDIVVLTGDLVDGSVAYLSDDVEPLKDINSKYGNFFVTGNHEYYSGVTAWENKLKDLGFKVLDHEYELINHHGKRVLLGGVPDYRGENFSIGHVSDPMKIPVHDVEADVKIMLAHQPQSIFKTAEAGYDLQLSGHTHGGQYQPWSLVSNMANPYNRGLHKHDNTWIYVSTGTGFWGPPLRFGTEQEITLVQFKNA